MPCGPSLAQEAVSKQMAAAVIKNSLLFIIVVFELDKFMFTPSGYALLPSGGFPAYCG
jgi:hypothetical protein